MSPTTPMTTLSSRRSSGSRPPTQTKPQINVSRRSHCRTTQLGPPLNRRTSRKRCRLEVQRICEVYAQEHDQRVQARITHRHSAERDECGVPLHRDQAQRYCPVLRLLGHVRRRSAVPCARSGGHPRLAGAMDVRGAGQAAPRRHVAEAGRPRRHAAQSRSPYATTPVSPDRRRPARASGGESVADAHRALAQHTVTGAARRRRRSDRTLAGPVSGGAARRPSSLVGGSVPSRQHRSHGAALHTFDEHSAWSMLLWTPPSLSLLTRFGAELAFLDGTFSTSDDGFVAHLLCVIHPDGGQVLPAVVWLSDSRTEESYVSVLQLLAQVREEQRGVNCNSLTLSDFSSAGCSSLASSVHHLRL